jgi:hypothetical protein
MYYLDTSVLLAFTLARELEPERYQAASKLFALKGFPCPAFGAKLRPGIRETLL